MPSNKAFQRRIQILDQCLRRRQMVWTVNALLEATNSHLADNGCPDISLRTLYDDLRYLQDILTAPVEKYQQGKLVCYRYSDPGYTLVNSPFSREEKELLRQMLAYLRANDLPMQADIESLLDRHGLLFDQDMIRSSIRMKKSEYSEPEENLAPAPRNASISKDLFTPDDFPLNKLVLRMEGGDFEIYRDSFWQWLQSDL